MCLLMQSLAAPYDFLTPRPLPSLVEAAMKALAELRGQAGVTRERPLEVVVLYTTLAETTAALRTASLLAGGLSARVRLLAPQSVPYALPVNEPAVPPSHTAARLLALVEEAGVEASVEILLCREAGEAVKQALPARAIVVLGTGGRWWMPGPRKLGRVLRKEGHHVVLACWK